MLYLQRTFGSILPAGARPGKARLLSTSYDVRAGQKVPTPGFAPPLPLPFLLQHAQHPPGD